MIERFVGPHFYLSNFYDAAPFVAPTYFQYGIEQELEFPTNEHWFNAHKAVTADDFLRVLEAGSPGEAKGVGRAVALRPGWVEDDLRVDVMRAGLRHKFTQNPDIQEKLLGTWDEYLQEGNRHGDRYWGVVWDHVAGRWEGENRLGVLLMELREELKDEA